MISVSVFKGGNFPVNTKKLKEVVTNTLEANGIVSDCVVDVAIVGEKKMEELNEKYYKDEVYMHPVFTFPDNEGPDFNFPPDSKLHLGQIVISYPMAVESANEKNKMIDDVIGELAEHSCFHLLGIHHE